MKRQRVVTMAVTGLLALSLQAQAQSPKGTAGGELFQQANSMMKNGGCDNARSAIALYKRAKKADSNLRAECDKRIGKCQLVIQKACPVALELSTEVVNIPYQGGEEQIGVIASKEWSLEAEEERTKWLNTRSESKRNFIVSCLEPNNSTRERSTDLVVKSGAVFKTLRIVQEGREEYLEANTTNLAFPAKGASELVGVSSNVNWDVTSVPDWCRIEKNDSTIRIIVLPNEKPTGRTENIVIVTPNNNRVTINIAQGAGDEKLTLSQNDIVLPADGGRHYMKVYTDAASWSLGDFPSWLFVEKVGNDSICIEADKNVPNGEKRMGSVLVKTGNQTAAVKISQEARLPVDVIFSESGLVGGRNLSLGVSASYYMPFVSASAGGDYVGSVVDYSLGTNAENASYKKAVGYSFGLFADMRLYKNIFLTAGVNFTQIKYENSFNEPTIFKQPHTTYQYLRGDVQNAYTEEYSHTFIEVPLLASYRFKLSDVSHVQLNLGPVLTFGASSTMKFNGNTDGDRLHIYSATTNAMQDANNYTHHTATSAEFNLYQPCVRWTESYTQGNVADVDHHDTFAQAPLNRMHWGLRLGAAYEIAGLSFGLSYTMMLSNMANDNYWGKKRWTVLNESNTVMNGYKHRIHTLEFKLAYTLRYLGLKKEKKNQ